jgi:15-cis-phytoene synthase
MKALFDQVSLACSKQTTNTYSTSFSIGIYMLDKQIRNPVYAIYGFVRLADEIVDSFHDFNKKELLDEFRASTYKSINDGISLNPILNSFQQVVNQYDISKELIDTFLDSMEMDLKKQSYNPEKYDQYIYGSAEVVGLMCLKVFCNGSKEQYLKLVPLARALGSAFQKINFLRDYKDDVKELGRVYFPNLANTNLDPSTKIEIENDIIKDFDRGYEGIKKLPRGARLGVYVAYVYYKTLFKKVQSGSVSDILSSRTRIPNYRKFTLLFGAYIRHQMNLL